MRTFLALSAALAFATIASLSAPAFAQAPGMGDNCMMQQIAKICPGAAMGTPEFKACMKEHAAEASAACMGQSRQKAGDDARADLRKKSPCMDDAKKFCPGKWPGTPEFSACMKEHRSDLTPACREYADKRMKEGHKPGDDVCVADAKKFCPGMTVNDGAKFAMCMSGHYDELAPACQAKFKGMKGGLSGDHGDCMAALQKVCPDAQPGTPAMMQCMVEHRAELPPSCHKHGKK